MTSKSQTLFVLFCVIVFLKAEHGSAGTTIWIDLDRSTQEIENHLVVPIQETSFKTNKGSLKRLRSSAKTVSAEYSDVTGSIIATGMPETLIGSFHIQVDVESVCGLDTIIDCNHTQTGPADIPDGSSSGVHLCRNLFPVPHFGRSNLNVASRQIGNDNQISIMHFDARILCTTGDTIRFTIKEGEFNQVLIDKEAYRFERENARNLFIEEGFLICGELQCPFPTLTPTQTSTFTNTPTNTPTPTKTGTLRCIGPPELLVILRDIRDGIREEVDLWSNSVHWYD